MNRALRAATARKNFSETLRLAEAGEVVESTRYGKPVAAMVGVEELRQRRRLDAAGPEASEPAAWATATPPATSSSPVGESKVILLAGPNLAARELEQAAESLSFVRRAAVGSDHGRLEREETLLFP